MTANTHTPNRPRSPRHMSRPNTRMDTRVICKGCEQLRTQRDELLAALKDMVHYEDLPAAEQQPAVERARAVIARATGGKQ